MPHGMRHADVDPHVNEISRDVVDAAIRVHRELGPGLLERAYQRCLAKELHSRGRVVETEVQAPVVYRGERVDHALRLDLLVDSCVVVEVKTVERLQPVHAAQLLTYLKLTKAPLGLLMSFNSMPLYKEIRRILPPRT